MKKIKAEKGWGIVVRNEYLLPEFFTHKYLAKRKAEKIYMEYAKRVKGLKTWKGVKKHFGISFVKCRLEVIDDAR